MPNRLASATSPYLLQHADNPVDWWEWGSEAFAEAKERDVPVLLSVGYAACHWCHVMAHESFEDEATAAYMNEHYVNVKVDREERPDVDAIYMQAITAMTGHGGWPMTVVLDHEGRPFFAGTYFPDRPRHGQPAFTQVLSALSQAWHERRDEVTRVGESLREHLTQQAAWTAAPITEDLLAAAQATLAREYDAARGGFGGAPKFPPSMVLEFLRRRGEREMLDGTLRAMAGGGMYDALSGGFARYSVDADWVVPHFEKMLYDNGQLLALYARWEDPLGERVARETGEFLLAELRTGHGAFASSLDADSEGEEGTFYVWTPAQLREVLGEDDGAWAAELLGVTESGTFERGTSTLQLRRLPDDVARWDAVRERLATAREERERPGRDDKVVAAWNGLAISGLVALAQRTGEERWLEAATVCAEHLWETHLVDGRLRRVSRDGVVGSPEGVLEDHGCLATAYVDLAAHTGDALWLERARVLLDLAVARFRDEATDAVTWFDTADDAERLISRPRDPSDNASPAGTSALVHALLGYAALTGSGEHHDLAVGTLSSLAALMGRAPRFAGWTLAAACAVEAPEVAIVGAPGPERDALAAEARRRPGVTVLVSEPGSEVPLAEGRGPIEGRAAAYVCRGMVCDRPVTDVADLAALLRD